MNEVISAVWKRAIEPEAGTLSPDQAQALLQLDLAGPDAERARLLAAKARSEKLSPREDQELNTYTTAGRVIEFLKSKARRSLQQTQAAH